MAKFDNRCFVSHVSCPPSSQNVIINIMWLTLERQYSIYCLFSKMAEREVPFINVTLVPKEKATLTESQQRITRSHAARSAHARVRHRRMMEYQAQKRGRIDTQDGVISSRTGFQSSAQLEIATVLSSNRRDPFHSFARGLTSLEQFLFDHCMAFKSRTY